MYGALSVSPGMTPYSFRCTTGYDALQLLDGPDLPPLHLAFHCSSPSVSIDALALSTNEGVADGSSGDGGGDGSGAVNITSLTPLLGTGKAAAVDGPPEVFECGGDAHPGGRLSGIYGQGEGAGASISRLRFECVLPTSAATTAPPGAPPGPDVGAAVYPGTYPLAAALAVGTYPPPPPATPLLPSPTVLKPPLPLQTSQQVPKDVVAGALLAGRVNPQLEESWQVPQSGQGALELPDLVPQRRRARHAV